MLTDIHSHSFEKRSDLIRITSLCETNLIELKLQQPGIFSIGIHPRFINENKITEDLECIRKHVANPKVAAIGECGLDKFSVIKFDQQLLVFEKMIQLSEESSKPLIIHCVRYHQELISLKKLWKPTQPWILHGFNNKISIAENLTTADFYFSFGAAILEAHFPAAEVLKIIPENRIFFESDENGDAILAIFARAAAILNLPQTQLENKLLQRFCKVFHYDAPSLAQPY